MPLVKEVHVFQLKGRAEDWGRLREWRVEEVRLRVDELGLHKYRLSHSPELLLSLFNAVAALALTATTMFLWRRRRKHGAALLCLACSAICFSPQSLETILLLIVGMVGRLNRRSQGPSGISFARPGTLMEEFWWELDPKNERARQKFYEEMQTHSKYSQKLLASGYEQVIFDYTSKEDTSESREGLFLMNFLTKCAINHQLCSEYWLLNHSQIVLAVSRDLGMVSYVQTHTRSATLNPSHPEEEVMGSSVVVERTFDGMTQVWFDPLALLGAAILQPLTFLSADRTLLQDERRFLDLSRCTVWFSSMHSSIQIDRDNALSAM
eukprot:scaffold175271_cov41-Tisochrysis_lutea.AAC.2